MALSDIVAEVEPDEEGQREPETLTGALREPDGETETLRLREGETEDEAVRECVEAPLALKHGVADEVNETEEEEVSLLVAAPLLDCVLVLLADIVEDPDKVLFDEGAALDEPDDEAQRVAEGEGEGLRERLGDAVADGLRVCERLLVALRHKVTEPLIDAEGDAEPPRPLPLTISVGETLGLAE